MMPNIGAPELIIILVIALLILGPGKLPEVGASLGKSIREFRKASTDVQDAVNVNVDTSPLPAAPAPAAAAPVAAAPVAAAPVAPRRAGPGRAPSRRCPRSTCRPAVSTPGQRATAPAAPAVRLDHGRELAGRPQPDHGRRRRPARAGCQRHPRGARSRTRDPARRPTSR